MNTQNPMILMYSLNYVVREHKKTMDRMDKSVMEVDLSQSVMEPPSETSS